MKKRILIFNWRDIKHPQAGGAEVYLDEVFSKLAQKGYQITLLCCRFPESSSEERVNGIQVIRIGSPWLINLRSIFWYLKNKERFDLVIDFTNKIPYLTSLFVKNKPCIAIAHDVFGKILIKELGILGCILAKIEKWLFSFYKKSYFIAVSKSTKDELVEIGINPLNIKVIYQGVSHSLYLPSSKSKQPLILYLGRLKKYKRVDLILKVLKDLVNLITGVCLVIIGTGSDKKRLEKIVKKLKLEPYVSFLGFLPEAEKVKWLQKAWVTVQPSIKEGWGLTVIEAGTCETPTIASNVPGLKDSVLDGKTGWLFEENDLDGLKNILIEVLTNKEKRNKAEREALKFAEQFSWDKTTNQIEQEIKRMTK